MPLWLWFLLALLALFAARGPVHQGLLALSRVVHQVLRLAASSVSAAEQRLQRRNREVLLARAREALEWQIDREFTRVESTVKRELSRYPALHRKLCEQLTAVDEDYVRSAEVPPEPTNWPKAIRAVAEIPAKEDPVVRDVLEIIHSSMRKAESKALEAYRESARERHQLLKRMMPGWRSILTALGRVNRNVESVIQRAQAVDGHMQRYEELLRGGEQESRRLAFSALGQFLVSSLMLGIAAGAAMLNTHLLSTPLQALLGAEPTGFPLASSAAVVLVALQLALGVFILEAVRITRMFPAIGALADNLRARLFWLLFGLLCTLGILGAILAASGSGLSAGPAIPEGTAVASWVAVTIRAGLALVLPMALVFSAVPLESFLNALRAVLGLCGVLLLRVVSLTLRVMGAVVLRSGAVLVHLYDIVIFLPLWMEHKVIFRRRQVAESAAGGAESGR
nr:hypothetical protein [Microbulbifer guangxiensis]